MILIYGFVAFLFFKIFPEFAGYRSNTVVGALVMAAVSALILQAGTWAAAWRVGTWVQTPPADTIDLPSGLWLISAATIAASVGSTFLIGIGFSDGLMRSAFKGYSPDPWLFWVMAALPPLAHFGTVAPKYVEAIRVYRAARRDSNLKM